MGHVDHFVEKVPHIKKKVFVGGLRFSFPFLVQVCCITTYGLLVNLVQGPLGETNSDIFILAA